MHLVKTEALHSLCKQPIPSGVREPVLVLYFPQIKNIYTYIYIHCSKGSQSNTLYVKKIISNVQSKYVVKHS